MLALAVAVVALLGLALPLDPQRREDPPSLHNTPLQRLKRVRRAPLAEHGWESRVLCNLTKSEF